MTVIGDDASTDRHPPAQARPEASLDPDWVRDLAGVVVASPRPRMSTVLTPFTGRELAQLPISEIADVDLAFEGARAKAGAWRALPIADRAAVLLAFHDLVLAEQEALLDLIQLESGKARAHAFDEVIDVAQVARFCARRAPRLLRPRRRPGLVPVLTEVLEVRHPHGVVGVVTPWNYPLSMGITDVLAALVAGNTVVLRPDPQGSLTALLAVRLLQRAGMPSGVVQVVLGDGPDIGAAVLSRADKIVFTGSTRTGRAVAREAGERLVSAGLELGGKNALYVAADADLDRAVPGAVRACFSSAGQLCVSIERIYLHDTIAQEFVHRFVGAVEALRLGARLDYDADLGSLTSAAQLRRIEEHVEDARAHGARVLTGGRARPDIGPWFFEPTVLEDVTADMRLHREETFGPVVAISPVDSDAAAIAAINDSDYGLNASVWTRDTTRGRTIAAAIQTGSVNVNEGFAASYASSAAPMGGVKASGMGRRHGDEGLLAHTWSQTIATQHLCNLDIPAGVRPERFTALATAGLKLRKWLGSA